MKDTFATRAGNTWTRSWVGDNAGRYEWTSGDLKCWRTGHRYYASVSGNVLEFSSATLLDAMQAAEAAARRAA